MRKLLIMAAALFLASPALAKEGDPLLLKHIAFEGNGGHVEFFCIAGDVWKTEYVEPLEKQNLVQVKRMKRIGASAVITSNITCDEFMESMERRKGGKQ